MLRAPRRRQPDEAAAELNLVGAQTLDQGRIDGQRKRFGRRTGFGGTLNLRELRFGTGRVGLGIHQPVGQTAQLFELQAARLPFEEIFGLAESLDSLCALDHVAAQLHQPLIEPGVELCQTFDALGTFGSDIGFGDAVGQTRCRRSGARHCPDLHHVGPTARLDRHSALQPRQYDPPFQFRVARSRLGRQAEQSQQTLPSVREGGADGRQFEVVLKPWVELGVRRQIQPLDDAVEQSRRAQDLRFAEHRREPGLAAQLVDADLQALDAFAANHHQRLRFVLRDHRRRGQHSEREDDADNKTGCKPMPANHGKDVAQSNGGRRVVHRTRKTGCNDVAHGGIP